MRDVVRFRSRRWILAGALALWVVLSPGTLRANEEKKKADQEFTALKARAERLQAKGDSPATAAEVEREWSALVADVKTWASKYGVPLLPKNLSHTVSTGQTPSRCRRYANEAGIRCFLLEVRTEGKVTVCIYGCAAEVPKYRDRPVIEERPSKQPR